MVSESDHRETKRKRTKGKSPDPYQRAFLRQAVAIVAAERGFNESSQAKLQRLANQLGLSDRAFRKAVEELKRPNNSFGLNRYEKRFVEFVVDQFKQFRSDVLHITAEEKLVKIAGRKYQIDAVRARQLIQTAAEQNQIATISHVDAEQFARQLVEDTVNSSVSLSATEKQRLHHVCKKWGFHEQKVDNLLTILFLQNRKARRRRTMLLAGIVLIGISIVGSIAYAAKQTNWENLFAKLTTKEVIEPAFEETANPNSTFPEWWDKELVLTTSRLAQQSRRLTPLVAGLSEPEADNLASVYKQLTRKALDSGRLDPEMARTIALLYHSDPNDEHVAGIERTIRKALSIDNLDKPATASQIRKSWRATELLASMLTDANNDPSRPNSPIRTQNLKQLHEELVGIELPKNSLNQYLRDARPRWALDQWSHALKFSKSHPKSVAGFLTDLESPRIVNAKGINELRTQVVQTIVQHSPIQWSSIRDSISISIQQGGAADIVAWYRILSQIRNRSLSNWLTEQLGARLGIVRGKSRDATRQALRDYCRQHFFPQHQATMQANHLLQTNLNKLHSDFRLGGILVKSNEIGLTESAVRYELLANIAHNNNLQLAWILAVEQSTSLEDFERIYANPPTADTLVAKTQELRKPTPSEISRFRESFDRIFQTQPSQVSARITAINSIRELAGKFPDIDYPIARQLVTYIFQSNETREALAIDRALRDLAHWMNVKLAIVDHVHSVSEPLDKVLDVLSRLGIDNIQIGTESNWNRTVQTAVLQHCLDNLDQTARIQFQNAWLPIEQALRQPIRERGKIIAGNHRHSSPQLKFPDNWILDLREHIQFHGLNSRYLKMMDLIATVSSRFTRLSSTTSCFADVLADKHNVSQPKVAAAFVSGGGDIADKGRQVLAAEVKLHSVLSSIREKLLDDWN